MTDISMGNPHAVVFVDDLETFLPVAFPDEGPQLSTYHEIFPEGANAGFAQVSEKLLLYVRMFAHVCVYVCVYQTSAF